MSAESKALHHRLSRAGLLPHPTDTLDNESQQLSHAKKENVRIERENHRLESRIADLEIEIEETRRACSNRLRLDAHTQYETRQVAEKISAEMANE